MTHDFKSYMVDYNKFRNLTLSQRRELVKSIAGDINTNIVFEIKFTDDTLRNFVVDGEVKHQAHTLREAFRTLYNEYY